MGILIDLVSNPLIICISRGYISETSCLVLEFGITLRINHNNECRKEGNDPYHS